MLYHNIKIECLLTITVEFLTLIVAVQPEEEEGTGFTCSQRKATKVLAQLYPEVGMCRHIFRLIVDLLTNCL